MQSDILQILLPMHDNHASGACRLSSSSHRFQLLRFGGELLRLSFPSNTRALRQAPHGEMLASSDAGLLGGSGRARLKGRDVGHSIPDP